MVGPAEVFTVLAGSAAATIVLTNPRARRLRSGVVEGPARVVDRLEPQLAVRVLGPVAICRDGTTVGLTGRQAELVAYLACHPAGVTEDQLRTALWGDQPATRGSFNNLVSATRRRLGSIGDGPALPAVGEDRCYRLHPAVDCDLRLLQEADSPAGRKQLLQAVRGRPFDAPRGFGWADRKGLTGWAATRIATAAHDEATDYLTADNPRGALRAAQQGLLAGLDERLFADRMHAHAALGEHAGVEKVLEELLAVYETDALEVLHPDTIDAYRRCGGRRPFRAAG